jgi:hypothetical protein
VRLATWRAGHDGDEGGRVGAAWEQGADLRLVGCIVEHHENSLLRELRPVPRRSLLDPLRNRGPSHAELQQELTKHIGRCQPLHLGAPQVDVELTIWEAWLQLMGKLRGQRGLADPGPARDRRHDHVDVVGGRLQSALDRSQVVLPAGEVVDVRGELEHAGPHRRHRPEHLLQVDRAGPHVRLADRATGHPPAHAGSAVGQTEPRNDGSEPDPAMRKIPSINTLLRSAPSLMVSAKAAFVYPICLLGYDPATSFDRGRRCDAGILDQERRRSSEGAVPTESQPSSGRRGLDDRAHLSEAAHQGARSDGVTLRCTSSCGSSGSATSLPATSGAAWR